MLVLIYFGTLKKNENRGIERNKKVRRISQEMEKSHSKKFEKIELIITGFLSHPLSTLSLII